MSQPSATLQRALPFPNRALSLWRGCRYAMNVRPWMGRNQSGPLFAHDSRSKNRGRFTGTPGNTNTLIKKGGRFANSNAGQSNLCWDDIQWNAIPQLGIMMWQDTGGMSLACTMQFTGAALPAGNRRILTKRFGTAANFHCGALSFAVAGNKFEFSYCNGVATQSILSATSPVVGTTYNIVGRHWGNNALSRAELWVNGKLEAVNAAPATYPAYKKDPPLCYFGDTGSGDPTVNAVASMGGLWDRPLTTAEIRALNANPYIMWGPPVAPVGMPFSPAGGGLSGCSCPGWLINWNDM